MGESRETLSGLPRGQADKPLEWADHMEESPSFMNLPSQSLFSRRLTPPEVVSLWHVLTTCSSSTLTATPQPASAPEQQQQQQQQQQRVDVIEEASPTGAANKSQSKTATPQPGSKPSEKEKKHRKSQKEQKVSQPLPKKHSSSSGRPGVSAASPAVSTPQAVAAGSTGEALTSGCESRPGAPSLHGSTPSAERGDPGEAIRVALGVATGGMGREAALGLVVRALLFCKDYLLQPDITCCVINFLGVQLQWLSYWGSCTARRLPSACKQEAREQTEPGRSVTQTGATTLEEISRSGCPSFRMKVGTAASLWLRAPLVSTLHLGFLWRHLTRETERLLTHLRGYDLLNEQQNVETLCGNKAGVAEEFEPALKGSISATEAEMLYSFLLNALINHGYFFAVVLASSLAPGEPQTGKVAAAAAPPLTC
ncbi:hypothetical protein Esti_004786 [Eimeria stiedai]